MSSRFAGGRNIALKVPPHQHAATVRFYGDVLGLEPVGESAACFAFGTNRLWVDRVEGLSQAEIWLEVVTDEGTDAARALETAGVVRCDEIEPLPEGFDGFWITSPAAIVHLVSRDES